VLTLDPAVMELAPWSPSMADLAIGCPQAFHRKYILKEAPIETAAAESSVGTLVHRILEWTLRTQGPLTLEEAYRHAYDTLDPPYEIYLQARTYRDAVKDFLVGMDHFKEKFGVTETFVERKLALAPDFKLAKYNANRGPDKALIRGVIDYIVFTKDGKAAIFDHKTGAVKPISMYDSQARVYSLFADALFPRLRYTRMGIHYVGADPNAGGGRTVWAPEYPIETVRTRFRQELIGYLNEAAKDAQLDEPRKSWRCNYCGYRPVCPLQLQN
jgi:RecB family exonuclease